MKKIFMIITLMLIMASFTVAQEETGSTDPMWIAEVVQACGSGVCLEGTQAIWQVTIQNVGTTDLVLEGISLVDSSNVAFASQDLSQEQAVIPAGKAGNIKLAGIVPPATRGSTLYYRINYYVGGRAVPDSSFRNMLVMPRADVECTHNDYCNGDDVCIGYRCTPYSLVNQSLVEKPEREPYGDGIDTLLLIIIAILLVVVVARHRRCNPSGKQEKIASKKIPNGKKGKKR